MLQSPLYIDIKCTTVGSPRAKSLGFRSRLTPRRAAGGFEGCLGHEGCEYGLRNERLSQCEVLRELQVGRETEQRLLQEPGKVEAGAARGVRCPEDGCVPPSPGLEGRDAVPRDLLRSPSPCAHVGKGALCAG